MEGMQIIFCNIWSMLVPKKKLLCLCCAFDIYVEKRSDTQMPILFYWYIANLQIWIAENTFCGIWPGQ